MKCVIISRAWSWHSFFQVIWHLCLDLKSHKATKILGIQESPRGQKRPAPRLPRREAGGLLPGRGGSLRAGRACSGACGEGTPRCAKARPGQVPGRVGAVEQGSLGRARPRKPRLRRRCASLAGRGPLAPGDGKEWGRVKPSPVAFPPQLPGPAASQFR